MKHFFPPPEIALHLNVASAGYEEIIGEEVALTVIYTTLYAGWRMLESI